MFSPVRRFAARVAVAKARIAREGGGCRSAADTGKFSEVHFTHVVQPCFQVVEIVKLGNKVLKRQYRFTMD